jgi:hypothetical protein
MYNIIATINIAIPKFVVKNGLKYVGSNIVINSTNNIGTINKTYNIIFDDAVNASNSN